MDKNNMHHVAELFLKSRQSVFSRIPAPGREPNICNKPHKW
jgi:hypothetical protein